MPEEKPLIDWAMIIHRGYESKDLDYKAPCVWLESNKRACCELAKDVLAMANTSGGRIVIGVQETGTGFSPIGLTVDEAKTFEVTRLNRFLNNYADPPVNTYIHKPKVGGNQFVVIEVPAFTDTPHVCQRDFPDVLTATTIYVRTDNNESAPLKSSADFRSIVEKAIRNRSDQLLSSFQTILRHGVQPSQRTTEELYDDQVRYASDRANALNPHSEKQYGYRASVTFPAVFDPSRFELPDLKKMATNASVDLRGWPYIFIHESRKDLTYAIDDGYETFDAEPHPSNGGDTFHFWQLRRSGLMYAHEILRVDTWASLSKDREPYLDFDDFSILAGEAVLCLIKLYEGNFADSDEVVFRFTLGNIEGRSIGSSNARRYIGRHRTLGPRCRIPEIRYEAMRTYADWRSGIVDHSLDLCQFVFQRFNLDSPPIGESRKLIEDAFGRKLI